MLPASWAQWRWGPGNRVLFICSLTSRLFLLVIARNDKMSSLANSPVPPPSVATDVAHSPLFGLLSSAVEVQVVTPGVMFAPARPQLLPSHVPYKDVLRELPHIGYVDVLIDVSGDDIDDEYRSPEGFAFRTAWIADSAGSRAILHAVTALTPVDHFAFSARDGAWLPAEDVWRDGLPPAVADAAGPGAVLLAFAHVVRDLFVGERIPGALTTRYGTCAHCPGCHTYASVAAQAASLRSMLAASAASLQVWPDATPERIVAASRLLRFPVMPHVACSSRAADTASSAAPPAEVVEVAATVAGEKRNRSEATAPPESTDGAARRSSATVPPSWVPRSPAGVLSGSTAAAWRALCAPGAPPAAALPLWDGLLHPELIRALVAPPGGRGVPGLLREEIPGAAWSFPLFTAAACGAVMDVAEQHEAFARRRGVRVTRPNSMNVSRQRPARLAGKADGARFFRSATASFCARAASSRSSGHSRTPHWHPLPRPHSRWRRSPAAASRAPTRLSLRMMRWFVGRGGGALYSLKVL